MKRSAAQHSQRVATPAPLETRDDVARAIERARQIDCRVRDQVLARLAFPWRFENGQGIEPMPPLSVAELEDLIWELDFRYRQTLQHESEI